VAAGPGSAPPGRFSDASTTAEEAAARADASVPHLAADIRARLVRYRTGKPLLEVRP
jgi:hypothetical protein